MPAGNALRVKPLGTPCAPPSPRRFFRYSRPPPVVLCGHPPELHRGGRAAPAARGPEESVPQAVRRWSQEGLDHLLVNPQRDLTRSALVASIPAAHARSRVLDAEYEVAIAEALAGEETDIAAGAIARAAWGATRAARDVWLASDGELDPRALVDAAFERLGL